MRASGHKSEASIRSYSCRLTDAKKQEISECLSSVVRKNDGDVDKGQSGIIDGLSDSDLNAIFNDENVFVELAPHATDFGTCVVTSDTVSPVTTCTYTNADNSMSHTNSMVNSASAIANLPPQGHVMPSHSSLSSNNLSVLNELRVGGNILSKIPQFNIQPNISNCVVNFNFGQH